MGAVRVMDEPCNYRENDEEIYTITYRAPELLDPKCYTYTSSVDMWAVGCVLLDMIFCPSVTQIHNCSTSDDMLVVYTTLLQHNRELTWLSFPWEPSRLTTYRGLRTRMCQPVSLPLLVSGFQPFSTSITHNDRRDDLEAICHEPDLLANVVHARCYTTCSTAYEQDAKTLLFLIRHCLFYDPDRRLTASAALEQLAVLSKSMKLTSECNDLKVLLRGDYGRKDDVSKSKLYRGLAEAMGVRLSP